MLQIEVKGLDRLVKRLENYAKDLDQKKRDFLERLADIGVNTAIIRFADAEYDGTNDVVVERASWINENTIAVRATGSSVLFIEFGTGVSFPEHPQADEFGYYHGMYGKGQGMNVNGWIYRGEQGTHGMPVAIKDKDGKVLGQKEGIYRTFGNPPARAMYEASKDMRNELLNIAKEVFTP